MRMGRTKEKRMYPTIARLLDDAVANHGDRVALRMPIPKERKRGRGIQLVLNEITYARLGEMVGRFATALSELGVSPGDRVALISKPRAAWATTFFAILRCGAVVVPLDPELQRGEIERILREAEVKGIVISGGKTDDVLSFRSDLPGEPFVVSMDRVQDDRVLFLDALLLGKTELPRVEVDPSSLAILMYTSGTTGNAKGAMLTHANITSNALTAVKIVALTSEDNFLSIVPWNHIYGLTITLVTPMVVGATTTYTPVDRNLAQVMKAAHPTIILGVPKLYNVLYGRVMDSIRKSGIKRAIYRSSPSLMGTLVKKKLFGKQFRFFTSGGAPLSPEAAGGFRGMGLGLMEGYGLTETAPLLTMCEAFDEQPGMTAVSEIELRIKDPDENGVGEVLAKGPNIMAGYYKNPAATAEVIDADGWFHTGDLGTYVNGRLVLSGRAKNVIVLDTGKNVYPEEIEWEFATIPAIEEIMVHEGSRQGIPTVSAQVYPNWPALKGMGIESPEAALDHIWEAIKERSENLAVFKRIKYKESIALVDEPFEKSVKLDIKRHLHQQ
jgi:long-chain acyl-CoA synthetase